MKIGRINKSQQNLPEYVTEQSAGMDIQENIDADCSREACIILINLSHKTLVINDRERICPMIIARHERVE